MTPRTLKKVKTKAEAVKAVAEMSWQRTKRTKAYEPKVGWAEFYNYCTSCN